jgi:hypothetical protein
MQPLRCLVSTLVGGTVLILTATGCAEKRQSTRYLSEPWPSATTQAEAAATQTEEEKLRVEDTTTRTQN